MLSCRIGCEMLWHSRTGLVAQRIAEIRAQTRAFESVGQPSSEEALREHLLGAQVTQEEIAAKRARAKLDAVLGVSVGSDPLAGVEVEALRGPQAREAVIKMK